MDGLGDIRDRHDGWMSGEDTQDINIQKRSTDSKVHTDLSSDRNEDGPDLDEIQRWRIGAFMIMGAAGERPQQTHQSWDG